MSQKKSKKLTLAQIKKAYPKPRKYNDCIELPKNSYCVLGACLMMAKGNGKPERFYEEVRFPTANTFCQDVFGMEGQVDSLLYDKVSEVFVKNDAGKFSVAWKKLEKLLPYINNEICN